ncbi:unnamed protein product [Diabrotica balteata]|uniref:Glucose-methanol-choline oxidoreductase N-terminal domain-containing protein n=1 Tax=Diabrotica balteata TaxID=107213 RepID=A0A9N9SRU8_DIABA|nr:unnamed protein product [Diabrotica balteata]
MYRAKLLVIFTFLLTCGALELEPFYEFVSEKFEQIQKFELPTNNEKVFRTNDTKIFDFGRYDFIIVGADAGGSVLANRLSEISSWKILLLEAGGETDDFSDVPEFNNYLQQTDMNWGYLTAPQTTCCQGMENHQCMYPRGKVIGGCTTLNAAIYARGSPSDFNSWVAMGNPGWSYEEVLPYFKKSEYVAMESYDKYYHGTEGVLFVNHTSPNSTMGETVLKAHMEKGLKEVDYNGEHQLGVSKVQFNQKDHKHQTSEHAFLDAIKNRDNLKIVLNAAVNQILLTKHKAKGVTFVKNGKIYKAKAKMEVILSAGAINTPQLLMLSGIGPKKHLKDLAIPVIADLPAVGQHLLDHPLFVNIYFRTNISTPNNSLKENLQLYLEGKAPLTNGASLEHLAFINVDTITDGEADIEFLNFAPPFGVPGDLKAAYNFQDKFAKQYDNYNPLTDVGILMSLMKPKSHGSVTLKSNNILDFPLIDLNYFSDPKGQDLETMYKGIKYILSLADTEAFKSIGATFISKQPNCEHLKDNDREYWYCAFKHMTSTEYHPASTTRMGPSAADSVVDKNCLVHTFKNLRIVDAGVVPDITRGHLMAAVYMIAEKISDVIKKNYKKI